MAIPRPTSPVARSRAPDVSLAAPLTQPVAAPPASARDALSAECDRLAGALAQKDAALRELQHRAKNCLQMVTSLLRLQHHRLIDPDARAAYELTLRRVEVLAILYRQVHETSAETRVDLLRYIREICETAHTVPAHGGAQVLLTVEGEPVTTSLYTAMPFGLIVSELVGQALDFGYPSDARLTVGLRTTVGGRARLTLHGNGRGLPRGFDSEADAGVLLVGALATQLGADLDIESGPGTAIALTFAP